MKWTYNDHQVEGAKWALTTIRSYGLAYLSWQERTRKTGTALLTVENSIAKSCLILTKKKALDGWQEHFDNLELTKKYTIINYESIHKRYKTPKGEIKYKLKYNPDDYDFIILDEAHHAISGIGRPSVTWKSVKQLTIGKPILYLSATAYSEHMGLIYHQLKLSDWSPFKHKNFFEWFKGSYEDRLPSYGIPKPKFTPYGMQESYQKYKDEKVLAKIGHLFDFKTRKEVGIEHEPTANVVKVPLADSTKELLRTLKKDEIIKVNGETIVCDSPPKLRAVHYQIEGGTIKTDNTYIMLPTLEKVKYIKANYDLKNIAVMCHFIAEREVLSLLLRGVPIYSADGHAEGVDLSHIAKVIVYSMSFKTSKYTQRLARQANHNRTTPIEVDILVCDKPGIGYEVYKTVAIKKENFDKNSYDRSTR